MNCELTLVWFARAWFAFIVSTMDIYLWLSVEDVAANDVRRARGFFSCCRACHEVAFVHENSERFAIPHSAERNIAVTMHERAIDWASCWQMLGGSVNQHLFQSLALRFVERHCIRESLRKLKPIDDELVT